MTNPFTIMDETYRVAWGDLVYMKENILEVIITGLVGPLLYLLAFGYGLGGSMSSGSESYLEFIVPGIIALSTLSCTFSTVAMKVLVQRLFYMSFDELLLCPVHISSVILGKTMSGVTRALISCTIIMVVGHLISPGVSIEPLAFVIVIAAGLTFSMFGLLAGMLTSKTQKLSRHRADDLPVRHAVQRVRPPGCSRIRDLPAAAHARQPADEGDNAGHRHPAGLRRYIDDIYGRVLRGLLLDDKDEPLLNSSTSFSAASGPSLMRRSLSATTSTSWPKALLSSIRNPLICMMPQSLAGLMQNP